MKCGSPQAVFRPLRLVVLAGILALAVTACRTPRSVLPPVAAEALRAEQAAQREAFLAADEARRARLHRTAFPLLRESARLFPVATRPALGLLLATEESFEEPYRSLVRARWDLAAGVRVNAVAQHSPAAAAGLQTGDRLVAAGGHALPASDARGFFATLQAVLEVGTTTLLTIERDGQSLETAVTPQAIADYRVRLRYDARVNALATGRTIVLNRGMLDFCENDTELAFIVAHELAHNALRHQREAVLNYLAGTAADLALLLLQVPSPNLLGLIGAHRPSVDYEAEADYVALYLLARTGHELTDLLGFWPRLASLAPEIPATRFQLRTHPDPAARQIRLRAAIAEIESLRAAGAPLAPRTR